MQSGALYNMSYLPYFVLDFHVLNLTNLDTFQEVAVKILMEQDFHGERFKEFLREVGSSSF